MVRAPGRSPLSRWLVLAAAVLVGAMIVIRFRMQAIQGSPTRTTIAPAALRPSQAHEPILTIPPPPAEDARKVALGARLFADVRLSAAGQVSCATCHDPTRGGADGRRTAVGNGGTVSGLNTPTIFNAALNPTQSWDGSFDSLEGQLDHPITSAASFGSTWKATIATVNGDPDYANAFRRIYGGPVTEACVKDVIASYERTLIMRDSRFDHYLDGDLNAVTQDELEGFALFKSYGCPSCHQGRNVGGNVFEVLGVFGDYFQARGTPVTEQDLGRFNVTQRPEDRFRFRVPSLRLVALTAPYLHDGTAATLDEVIVLMGRFQLGEEIPPAHVTSIARFLATLAGSYAPGSPASQR